MKKISFANVTSGIIAQPERLIVYGTPGIGKTTFAASADRPVFIGAEKGSTNVDVSRFPQPESWAEILAILDLLDSDEHEFKTLVIDTLDWVEPLVHRQICEVKKVESIGDVGYGNGYNMALDSWRTFLVGLEKLCDRGMNVIMLAHMHIKLFKNPEGDPYDRYEMKLHHKASALIQEWADEVLFANYETMVLKDGSTKKTRGVSTGERLLHTVRTAAYDAKSRHGLPESLSLNWAAYKAAKNVDKPEAVIAAIRTLLEAADEEIVAKAEKRLVAIGDDPHKLSKLRDQIAAKLA